MIPRVCTINISLFSKFYRLVKSYNFTQFVWCSKNQSLQLPRTTNGYPSTRAHSASKPTSLKMHGCFDHVTVPPHFVWLDSKGATPICHPKTTGCTTGGCFIAHGLCTYDHLHVYIIDLHDDHGNLWWRQFFLVRQLVLLVNLSTSSAIVKKTCSKASVNHLCNFHPNERVYMSTHKCYSRLQLKLPSRNLTCCWTGNHPNRRKEKQITSGFLLLICEIRLMMWDILVVYFWQFRANTAATTTFVEGNS